MIGTGIHAFYTQVLKVQIVMTFYYELCLPFGVIDKTIILLLLFKYFEYNIYI